MSQAKVDRYKEEKANRSKIMAKEKRNRFLTRCVGIIIAAAIVCWAGYSGYNIYHNNHTPDKTVVVTDAIDSYISGLAS